MADAAAARTPGPGEGGRSGAGRGTRRRGHEENGGQQRRVEGMGRLGITGGMQHGQRMDTLGAKENATPNGVGATAGAKTDERGRDEDGAKDAETPQRAGATAREGKEMSQGHGRDIAGTERSQARRHRKNRGNAT